MRQGKAVSRRAFLRRYWVDDGGATAIEYALICGIIATVVLSIAATGGAVEALYNKMAEIAGSLGEEDDG